MRTNFGVKINIFESENDSNIIHIEGQEDKVELAKNVRLILNVIYYLSY